MDEHNTPSMGKLKIMKVDKLVIIVNLQTIKVQNCRNYLKSQC